MSWQSFQQPQIAQVLCSGVQSPQDARERHNTHYLPLFRTAASFSPGGTFLTARAEQDRTGPAQVL